jgi:hypothetical protein
MPHHHRLVAALLLAAATAACSDSNPFIGKWQADSKDTSPLCATWGPVEVTDKSLRSTKGVLLYTLVEDTNDFVFDTKDKGTTVAVVAGKDDTMILSDGTNKCTMRRVK